MDSLRASGGGLMALPTLDRPKKENKYLLGKKRRRTHRRRV